MKEIDLQKLIQFEASMKGARLWRNNSGVAFICEHAKVCPHAANRPVRFGLANESAGVNKILKSSDLIGVTPVIITADMVGQTLGVFTSIEVKRAGWKYTGKGRDLAQKAWIDLVKGMGGIAKFINKLGEV